MSGSQIVSMNEQLRNQYRGQYSAYLAQTSELTSMQAEINRLQQQYAQEQAAQNQAQSGGATPANDGSAPVEPLKTQQVLQAEERGRLRRDTARVAFGSPRYGVGLNIPLGT